MGYYNKESELAIKRTAQSWALIFNRALALLDFNGILDFRRQEYQKKGFEVPPAHKNDARMKADDLQKISHTMTYYPQYIRVRQLF